MAFIPHKTLSGAAFPVQTYSDAITASQTNVYPGLPTRIKAHATTKAGDLLVYNDSDEFEVVDHLTNDKGNLAVAVNAAAANANLQVCWVTPDVLFSCPVGTGTYLIGETCAVDLSTMGLANVATEVSVIDIRATYMGQYYDESVSALRAIVRIEPAWAAA